MLLKRKFFLKSVTAVFDQQGKSVDDWKLKYNLRMFR